MSASKRDRVKARKEYERLLARQARRRQRQSRNRALGISLTLLVALVLIVWSLRPSNPTTPDAEYTEPYVATTSATDGATDDPLGQPSDGTTDSGADQPSDTATARHTDADGQPLAKPDVSVAEDRQWTGTVTINGQPITLNLDGTKAPQAVANFVYLAKAGYFDNTTCHRLTTSGIYVLQCGDPEASGMGGPGYNWGPIENAPSDDVYPTGTLAMARVGGDGESMGSQFFIVYQDSTIPSDAAGGYTVFGDVSAGLDVVQGIVDAGVEGGAGDGAPATPATIEKVEVQ